MTSEPTVKNNVDEQRYELLVDGNVIGLADYQLVGDVATFPHFEVDPEHQGGGMAGRLARFALDDCRAQSLKVRPVCPYLVTYMRRHPEDNDLLAE